ncbi:hypothetical protein [Methylobacterium sp. Leaf399]|uniref:hypothetical protein n=1 Tax=Methylobacterium sp. Leaf399 TaxID=1736364 RepID=UPI000AE13AC9|nr:hypothetical protein [Methylobacterium sp. Leaf399]
MKTVVMACAGLIFGIGTSAGLAQGTTLQRAACTPDVFKFCSGDIPNVERITTCLRQKKASLSSGCQAVFNGLEQTRVATRSIETGTDTSAWCAPSDPMASGYELWTAWCRTGAAE